MDLRFSSVLAQLVWAVWSLCDGVEALYGSTSPVKVITGQDFNKAKSSRAFLMEFFSSGCGHCKQFAPVYEQTAKALTGILPVRATEDSSVMGAEQVQGVPTIRLYLGPKASKPFVAYEGPREAKSLVEFVMAQLKQHVLAQLNGKKAKSKSAPAANAVISLDANTFYSQLMKDAESTWFVGFFASWCGHCKALKPTWQKLAEEMKPFKTVKIAQIDAVAHQSISQLFNVQGFPTLILFPPGPKSTTSYVPYHGERDLEAMSRFVKQYLDESAVQLSQLVSQDQLEAGCSKNVCVIAILPDLRDTEATGRNRYIKELKTVAKASLTLPLKFFWMEGGLNLEFEQALNLNFGYPAVVAMHLEKKKYGIYTGQFGAKDLQQFVSSLMHSRQRLYSIPEALPTLVTTKEWDGNNAPDAAESESLRPEKEEL